MKLILPPSFLDVLSTRPSLGRRLERSVATHGLASVASINFDVTARLSHTTYLGVCRIFSGHSQQVTPP